MKPKSFLPTTYKLIFVFSILAGSTASAQYLTGGFKSLSATPAPAAPTPDPNSMSNYTGTNDVVTAAPTTLINADGTQTTYTTQPAQMPGTAPAQDGGGPTGVSGSAFANSAFCADPSNNANDSRCTIKIQSSDDSSSGTSNSTAADPCNAALTQASNICVGTAGIGVGQQAAGVASIASASTANAGAACTMQSKIADGQAAMNLALAAACTEQIFSCRNACDPSKADPNDAKMVRNYTTNQSSCNNLGFYSGKYTAAAGVAALEATAAKQCAAAYNAAVVAPTPVLAETCAGNPNYAATHTLECYCASNPSDVKCLNSALALNPSGLAVPTSSSGLNKNVAADTSASGLGNAPTFPTNNGAPISPGAAGSSGGGGFGGGGPAQAALAATPDDQPASSGSGNGGNIFGGFGAGQGGFSYGSKSAGDAPGGLMGAAKALATKLNLNNLVPKRDNFANRAVAGMSVSAADGVTGPNGPTLWEKVSRRYQIKKGRTLTAIEKAPQMKIKYCLAALLFVVHSQSYAQTTTTDTNQAQATPAPASSGLTNAAGSSKSGSALAVVGEGITAGMGIYTGYQCATVQYPANVMFCFMAAQCALQLAQTMASQKGADNVNSAYTPTYDPNTGALIPSDTSGLGNGTTSGTGGSGTGAASTATTSGYAADLSKINGYLAKAGVSTSGNGSDASINLPGGTSVPANASPSALTAAGIDSGVIASSLADEKKAEAGLLAKLGAGAGTGTGSPYGSAGGKSISYGDNPNAVDGSGGLSGAGVLNAGRKPGSFGNQSVAGLSRKLGDESIGVKGDNIFEMINRRYRAQDQQNAFLKEK